jgi:hypothetical protein
MNLPGPETVVQAKVPRLARRSKPHQIKPIDTPTSGRQSRCIPPPMSTAGCKSVDQHEWRMVGIPKVAPVALLPSPQPFMMGSPFHILRMGLARLGPMGSGGLVCCTEHWWLVADGTGGE